MVFKSMRASYILSGGSLCPLLFFIIHPALSPTPGRAWSWSWTICSCIRVLMLHQVPLLQHLVLLKDLLVAVGGSSGRVSEVTAEFLEMTAVFSLAA